MNYTITRMSVQDAREWQRLHQPHINADPEDRADKGWDWVLLMGWSVLNGIAFGQKTETIAIRALNGDLAGMALVAFDYPFEFVESELNQKCTHVGNGQSRHKAPSFLWFISASPVTKSKGIKVRVGPAVFAWLVDEVRSRIGVRPYPFWLHADPKGGDLLLGFYEKYGNCRIESMRQLAPARHSDGRYFVHSDAMRKQIGAY